MVRKVWNAQHSIGIVVSIKYIHHCVLCPYPSKAIVRAHTHTHDQSITFRLAVSENCLHILRILCVVIFFCSFFCCVLKMYEYYLCISPNLRHQWIFQVERVRENRMQKMNETSFSSNGHQRLVWFYPVRCSVLFCCHFSFSKTKHMRMVPFIPFFSAWFGGFFSVVVFFVGFYPF